MNIHAHRKGATVTLTGTGRTRRLAPRTDREGLEWSDPGYYTDTFTPGLTGIVTSVESHGMNPWTRYAVKFTDGTTASGLAEATDITFN